MSEWIISIVGVICLGLLLEIVLPEGQTSKYVKGTFSLLVIFVIIAPLPTFIKGDWKLNLDGIDYQVDDNFVVSTISLSTENVEEELEDYLLLNGYTTEVTITLKDNSINEINSVQVSVRLLESERDEFEQHIENVRGLVAGRLKEPKSKVFVEICVENGGDASGG